MKLSIISFKKNLLCTTCRKSRKSRAELCQFILIILFYIFAENVPVTSDPEALKEMRKNLAMELLWVQQAIDSRKNVRFVLLYTVYCRKVF